MASSMLLSEFERLQADYHAVLQTCRDELERSKHIHANLGMTMARQEQGRVSASASPHSHSLAQPPSLAYHQAPQQQQQHHHHHHTQHNHNQHNHHQRPQTRSRTSTGANRRQLDEEASERAKDSDLYSQPQQSGAARPRPIRHVYESPDDALGKPPPLSSAAAGQHQQGSSDKENRQGAQQVLSPRSAGTEQTNPYVDLQSVQQLLQQQQQQQQQQSLGLGHPGPALPPRDGLGSPSRRRSHSENDSATSSRRRQGRHVRVLSPPASSSPSSASKRSRRSDLYDNAPGSGHAHRSHDRHDDEEGGEEEEDSESHGGNGHTHGQGLGREARRRHRAAEDLEDQGEGDKDEADGGSEGENSDHDDDQGDDNNAHLAAHDDPRGPHTPVQLLSPEQIRARRHFLKAHTLVLPQKCAVCMRNIGFQAKYLKCTQCQNSYHMACKAAVPHDCRPPPFGSPQARKRKAPPLGTNLMALVAHDHGSYGHGRCPRIIEDCLRVLNHRAIAVEGIYRVQADKAAVAALRDSFFVGSSPANLAVVANLHEVAQCLLLFLRDLDEPAITFAIYPQMMAAVDKAHNEETIFAQLQRALRDMHPSFFELLYQVIKHLKLVAQHIGVTKMSAHALSQEFAPCLIRSPQGEEATERNKIVHQKIVFMLIQLSDEVWSSIEDYMTELGPSKLVKSPSPGPKLQKQAQTPTKKMD